MCKTGTNWGRLQSKSRPFIPCTINAPDSASLLPTQLSTVSYPSSYCCIFPLFLSHEPFIVVCTVYIAPLMSSIVLFSSLSFLCCLAAEGYTDSIFLMTSRPCLFVASADELCQMLRQGCWQQKMPYCYHACHKMFLSSVCGVITDLVVC